MATVKNYIKKRGSTYHYERRYPVTVTRLTDFDKGLKFQISLGTSDIRVARSRAIEKDREFDRICAEALKWAPSKPIASATPLAPSAEPVNLTDSFLHRLSEQYFREFVQRDTELEQRAETDEFAADELEFKATRYAPVRRLDVNGNPVDEALDDARHKRFLLKEFTSDTDHLVEDEARKRGIEIGSSNYKLIEKAIVKARLRAYHAGYDKKPGDMFPPGYSPGAPPINLALEIEWSLRRLSEEYIKNNKLKPAWLDKVKKAVATFEDYNGAAKLATSIDRKKVKSFTRFLLQAPINATQYFPGMSLTGATEANNKRSKPYPTIAPNTVKNGYIGPLRKVFSYAVAELDYSENPFANTTVEGAKRNTKKTIFDTHELNALFALPLYRGCRSSHFRLTPGNYQVDDEAFWTPLLMLFTGARVSEIAQLAISDIKLETKVPYIDILTEYDPNDPDDKPFVLSGKSDNAKRRIPIHPQLLRIGFSAYVEKVRKTGQPRLFPKWKKSSNEMKLYSSASWCNQFNQKLVRAITARKPKPTLYSLRHVFKTRMAMCGVSPQFQNEILGHTQAGMDSTYLHLAQDIEALQRAINLVQYEGLNLPDRSMKHLRLSGYQ
ncbi:site-specific integrase [Asticcacaulis endophyticus]|nr:site-specific integrase [Asticcacaulis endophyticus]